LDALSGYLMLCEQLIIAPGLASRGWNFGPDPASEVTVGDLVSNFARRWDGRPRVEELPDSSGLLAEAQHLALDSTDARSALAWRPLFSLDETIALTADWYHAFISGGDAVALTDYQISLAESLRSSAESSVAAPAA
jgi:CDP-glucose 4,6-dehydratase